MVNFNDEYYLDQDFTADIKKLQDAWKKWKPAAARRFTTRSSPRPTT